MKIVAQTILLFFTIVLVGCNRSSDSSSTKLSVVVWSSFPPTNSYHHLEHLTNLIERANALLATNPSAILGQNHGLLGENPALRSLLGIPQDEAAYISWSATIDHRFIVIRSPNSGQRFGRIQMAINSGRIDSCQDVEALYSISEMEHKLRQVVGTREEALRLFRGGLPKSPSVEQQQAVKIISDALFLPPDAEIDVSMSAPGGTNMGQGYLTIVAVADGRPEYVARVFYGIDGGFRELFAQFGLVRNHYKFGGLALMPAWTNLNTQNFLLDSKGIPYPKN